MTYEQLILYVQIMCVKRKKNKILKSSWLSNIDTICYNRLLGNVFEEIILKKNVGVKLSLPDF